MQELNCQPTDALSYLTGAFFGLFNGCRPSLHAAEYFKKMGLVVVSQRATEILRE